MDINKIIIGAEGLLNLEFYEDAKSVYDSIYTKCQTHYRYWLGMARYNSQNFTDVNMHTRNFVENAFDCVKSIDEYLYLKAAIPDLSMIKPYSNYILPETPKPNTNEIDDLKAPRIDISYEISIAEARKGERLKYLKFLLLLVILLGLPVGFIVSWNNDVNPIMNAFYEWREKKELEKFTSNYYSNIEVAENNPVQTESVQTENVATIEVCPYPVPAIEVSYGMKSDDVKWVQWHLIHWGSAIEESGRYDSETRLEVKKFQTIYELRIDGIAGPETNTKLIEVIANNEKIQP